MGAKGRRTREPCIALGPVTCFCAKPDEITEVTMAQRRVEAAQKALEGTHSELAELLQHEVEETEKLLNAEQARWFNSTKIAEAEQSLRHKRELLNRVGKVLKHSNAIKRPHVGSPVTIKANEWTKQACSNMIGQTFNVSKEDESNNLYMVEHCSFWFRRVDLEVPKHCKWFDDDGESSDSSSDSGGESSDDEDMSPEANARLKSLAVEIAPMLGVWKLDRCEGDMNGILEDANVDWMTKKTAKSFNYGAGIVTHTIEHGGGSKVTIVYKGGLKTLRTDVDITGKQARESQGEDGNDIVVKAKWDGKAQELKLEGTMKKTGATIQISKRYMQGNELVQEVFPVSDKYTPVKRIFKK